MLPVDNYKTEIQAVLSASNSLVFTAPPGSGKSTRLPVFLTEMKEISGEVVVLQPRRLAARMLAASVAKMYNFNLGSEVGYQVRGEKKRSANTRLTYRTDGLFLRQLINSDIDGIGAVVLDEFHERSWQTDVILPLLIEKQKTHPELKIVVMSATMETEKLCEYLKARLIICESRTYPVDIYYKHFNRNIHLWERAFSALNDHIIKANDDGNILVFMPGVFEINKTIDLCKSFKKFEVCALHGSMSPEKQDKALRSSTKNKIIVCTNIAETSLTVEGVHTVIDTGYSRVNRYNISKGIDALSLESISVFSAEQRSGRAGRLGPGKCYRLWSREEQGRKELSTAPEVFRIDLSEVLLQILKAGCDPNHFNWYERPSQDSIDEAMKQLKIYDALENGKLSQIGDTMSEIPAHPRISRFLIESDKLNCYFQACFWAAILSERSPVDNKTKLDDKVSPACDLAVITEICNKYFDAPPQEAAKIAARFKIKTGALKAVNTAFQQFLGLLPQKSIDRIGERRDNLVNAILSSFLDRLAVRVDRGTLRYRFANGRVAELTRTSSVRDAEFIVATETIELNSGGSSKFLIGSAVEVPYDLLEEKFLDKLDFKNEYIWNEKTRSVDYSEIIELNGLVIREQLINNQPVTIKAAEKLADKVLDGTLKLNSWNSKIDKWIEKVKWVRELFPEKNLPEYSEEQIRRITVGFCTGYRTYKEIKNIQVLDYFKNYLSWEDQQFVLDMTPERIELGNGKKVKIKYEAGKKPKISGFIQDFYGVEKTPEIAGGKVKVLVELLAPNRRPVHLTEDLEGFWDGVYKDIRSQLAGRYPKHKWI